MTYERAAELLSKVTVLDDPEMEEAHKMAISALRAQQEQSPCSRCGYGGKHLDAPLTLDEIREVEETGYPVWLTGVGERSFWAHIEDTDGAFIDYSEFGVPDNHCFMKKYYGEQIWAYRHKPEEAQK